MSFDPNADIIFNEATESDYYVASLADPQRYQVSIPDGNARAHVFRSETITANITAPATGRGIFVLYPNHPGSIVGSHYEWNGSSYVNRSDILVAQDLKANFNLVRKAAQVVTIRSSSIPSGVYALSGTMNVVQYDGMVSELSPATLDYASMLSLTTEAGNKLGNVLVGDGVAILSIPDCSLQPYVRLDDASPSAATYSGGSAPIVALNALNSSMTNSTSTTATAQFSFSGSTINGALALYTGTFNAASLRSFDVDSAWKVNVVTSGGTGLVPLTVRLKTELLDVFGNVLQTDNYDQTIVHSLDLANTTHTVPYRLTAGRGGFLPLAAIRLSFSLVHTAVLAITLTVTHRSEVEVANGELPGYLAPVTLVAYQGLATGTVLTVSGISNFELIPNADLIKNVTLKRTKPDADAWLKVHRVISQGSEIGFNPVVPLSKLPDLRMKLNAIATEDDHVASAMSFKSFLRKVKKGARAVLKSPVARLGINAAARVVGLPPSLGDQMLDAAQRMASSAAGSHIMANSAVGRTILPYAADGDRPQALKRRKTIAFAMDGSALTVANRSLSLNALEFMSKYNNLQVDPVTISGPNHEGDYSLNVPPSSRCVLFPALLFNAETAQCSGLSLYAAVPGQLGTALSSLAPKTKTRVYNYSGAPSVAVPFDVTFVPVRAVTPAGIMCYGPSESWVPVVGNSCDLALAILTMWGGNGLFPYVVSGKVTPRPSKKGPVLHIDEQPMFALKKRLLSMSNSNLRILANDPESDPPVTTVLQVLMLESGSEPSFLRSVYKSTRQPVNATVVAYAMDEDMDISSYEPRQKRARSPLRQPAEGMDEDEDPDDSAYYHQDDDDEAGEVPSTVPDEVYQREVAKRVKLQKDNEAKPSSSLLPLASRSEFDSLAATFDQATVGSALERPWETIQLALLGAQVAQGSQFAACLDVLIRASVRHKEQVDTTVRSNAASMATALVSAMLEVKPKSSNKAAKETELSATLYKGLVKRAETLASVLQAQFPFATAEWIVKNGGKGPNEGQTMYFSRTAQAPEPGREYPKDTMPAGLTKTQKVAEKKAAKRAADPNISAELETLRLNQVLKKAERMNKDLVERARQAIDELPPTPGKGLTESQIFKVKSILGLAKGQGKDETQQTSKTLGKEAAMEILRGLGRK